MNSAAAAFTWACWASISAGIASRRTCAAAQTSLPNLLRVLHRGEQCNAAAEGVADDVWLLEPEVVDEGHDVVGHESDVDRPIDVRGAPMSLEVDRDHLVPFRQRWEHRPEHLTRHEPAVQQDHRSARPVRLVVEADAVDVGVLARLYGRRWSHRWSRDLLVSSFRWMLLRPGRLRETHLASRLQDRGCTLSAHGATLSCA